MVVRRRSERREEKEKVRRALLRATLRLAASYGFASLSLREVAREAEIAPTSFYRHFEDMEQLGVALVDERVEPLVLTVIEGCREKAKRPWDVPEVLAHGLLLAIERDADLVRFVVAERVGSLDFLRHALQPRVQMLMNGLRDLMFSLDSKQRELPPAVSEALVLLTFEAAHKAMNHPDRSRDQIRDELQAQLALLQAGHDALRQGEP